jgi:hypothetical protein
MDDEEEEDFSSGRGGKPPKEHQIAAWRKYLTHPGVPEGDLEVSKPKLVWGMEE